MGLVKVWPSRTAVLGTPVMLGSGVRVDPFCWQKSPDTVVTGQ